MTPLAAYPLKSCDCGGAESAEPQSCACGEAECVDP